MKLLVISHKRCWKDPSSPTGYSTYGGFPLQMKALSELFDETVLLLPAVNSALPDGSGWLEGHNTSVQPLALPSGSGIVRKLGMLVWLPANILRLWRHIRCAGAVHTPVPGDIGTIGMVLSVIQGKPLFVRHCGNWLKDVSAAQRFVRWFMERYASGKRVMLATGGAATPPSAKNLNIRWVFSTSVTEDELQRYAKHRRLDNPGNARLIIVCRQEPGKNVDALIRAEAILRETYTALTLDVVGDGALLDEYRKLADALGVSDAVTFHGKLNHEGVMQKLSEADLFVFPTDSEGFPKAVLEAMAHGLPVASTGVSVLPDLLADGTGVLLKDPETATIVDTLRSVLADPERYEEMSRKAVARAAEYSLERWGDFLRDTMETAWGTPLHSQREQN